MCQHRCGSAHTCHLSASKCEANHQYSEAWLSPASNIESGKAWAL